jgi:outer membrane protein insertion porin family
MHGSPAWATRFVGPLLVVSLTAPGWVGGALGQEPEERGVPPLIRNIEFLGVEELSESFLRSQVATRPTRCRGILLLPFCLLSDGAVITERHRLDEGELVRDELRLRVAYFREGFREADADSEIRSRRDGVDVRFRLVEGPPTRVESMELEQTREVLTEGDLRAARLPAEGDPLSLNRLDRAIRTLHGELGDRGFLDASVRDSVEILVEGRRARVRVVIDPGAPSTVREIQISGNDRVADRTIIRTLHLEEGGPLSVPLIRQSRRALYETNLFHDAEVTVPSNQDSAKVVAVRVREAPPRMSRIGAGFSTLEFGQVEGRFSHYDWLGGGRRLDVRAALGNLLAPQLTDRFFFQDILPGELAGAEEGPFRKPTWQLSAEFQQPAFLGSANRLAVGAFANRRMIPGVSLDRGYGMETSLTRRLAYRVSLSLSYRVEASSVEAGDVFFCVTFGICQLPSIEALRERAMLSPLTLGFHLDRSDEILAATEGYRVRVDVEHASSPTFSDFRYHRIYAETSYYQPFNGPEPHVLAARVRAGWARPMGHVTDQWEPGGGDDTLLHPRKRLFAGGSRSVRGFPENQLGPRVLVIPRQVLLEEDRCQPEEIADGTCDPALAPADAFSPQPVGGTSLLEGSVEYRFPVGTTTLAVFLDGALISEGSGALSREATGAVTPGFGVRFPSPAGPIRIDLGMRQRKAPALAVITEAAAPDDPDRRLIRLDTRRRFDPLDDVGTLGRILGRLTLHLSIGEAF